MNKRQNFLKELNKHTKSIKIQNASRICLNDSIHFLTIYNLPQNHRYLQYYSHKLLHKLFHHRNYQLLIYMRAGQEKQYLQQFHQQKQAQIRKYFENEIWLPSDISYEFNEILNYLFDITQATTENLDESVVLNSSIAIEKAILSQMVVNNIFLITKSEIKMKQNESKFKLTQAFLFYVYVIYQYIRLFQNFNTITYDKVQKLFETMNQFNSQQQQLILGAGAVAFGKMKTISAKILAISSTIIQNTRSLQYAVDKIFLQQDLKKIFLSIFGYLKTFRNISITHKYIKKSIIGEQLNEIEKYIKDIIVSSKEII